MQSVLRWTAVSCVASPKRVCNRKPSTLGAKYNASNNRLLYSLLLHRLAARVATRLVVGQAVENNDTDDHDKQPDGYYYEQYEAEPS